MALLSTAALAALRGAGEVFVLYHVVKLVDEATPPATVNVLPDLSKNNLTMPQYLALIRQGDSLYGEWKELSKQIDDGFLAYVEKALGTTHSSKKSAFWNSLTDSPSKSNLSASASASSALSFSPAANDLDEFFMAIFQIDPEKAITESLTYPGLMEDSEGKVKEQRGYLPLSPGALAAVLPKSVQKDLHQGVSEVSGARGGPGPGSGPGSGKPRNAATSDSKDLDDSIESLHRRFWWGGIESQNSVLFQLPLRPVPVKNEFRAQTEKPEFIFPEYHSAAQIKSDGKPDGKEVESNKNTGNGASLISSLIAGAAQRHAYQRQHCHHFGEKRFLVLSALEKKSQQLVPTIAAITAEDTRQKWIMAATIAQFLVLRNVSFFAPAPIVAPTAAASSPSASTFVGRNPFLKFGRLFSGAAIDKVETGLFQSLTSRSRRFVWIFFSPIVLLSAYSKWFPRNKELSSDIQSVTCVPSGHDSVMNGNVVAALKCALTLGDVDRPTLQAVDRMTIQRDADADAGAKSGVSHDSSKKNEREQSNDIDVDDVADFDSTSIKHDTPLGHLSPARQWIGATSTDPFTEDRIAYQCFLKPFSENLIFNGIILRYMLVLPGMPRWLAHVYTAVAYSQCLDQRPQDLVQTSFWAMSLEEVEISQFFKQLASSALYWTTGYSSLGLIRPFIYAALFNGAAIFHEFCTRKDFLPVDISLFKHSLNSISLSFTLAQDKKALEKRFEIAEEMSNLGILDKLLPNIQRKEASNFNRLCEKSMKIMSEEEQQTLQQVVNFLSGAKSKEYSAVCAQLTAYCFWLYGKSPNATASTAPTTAPDKAKNGYLRPNADRITCPPLLGPLLLKKEAQEAHMASVPQQARLSPQDLLSVFVQLRSALNMLELLSVAHSFPSEDPPARVIDYEVVDMLRRSLLAVASGADSKPLSSEMMCMQFGSGIGNTLLVPKTISTGLSPEARILLYSQSPTLMDCMPESALIMMTDRQNMAESVHFRMHFESYASGANRKPNGGAGDGRTRWTWPSVWLTYAQVEREIFSYLAIYIRSKLFTFNEQKLKMFIAYLTHLQKAVKEQGNVGGPFGSVGGDGPRVPTILQYVPQRWAVGVAVEPASKSTDKHSMSNVSKEAFLDLFQLRLEHMSKYRVQAASEYGANHARGFWEDLAGRQPTASDIAVYNQDMMRHVNYLSDRENERFLRCYGLDHNAMMHLTDLYSERYADVRDVREAWKAYVSGDVYHREVYAAFMNTLYYRKPPIGEGKSF